MPATLKLSIAESHNPTSDRLPVEYCEQLLTADLCRDNPFYTFSSLKDAIPDYFELPSLDGFLLQSVESKLFAADIESIYDAAEAGDIGLVNAFLDSGIDIDEKRCRDGLTPLLVAARFGQQEICATLLDRGADLTATAVSRSTPLHEAAANGKAICCQLLLTAGSDPNAKDTAGQTPLHVAIMGGHIATVRLLLDAGACPSVATSSGDTPLQLAVEAGHEDVCQVLIQFGAGSLHREVSSKRKHIGFSSSGCSPCSKKHFVNSSKAISSY